MRGLTWQYLIRRLGMFVLTILVGSTLIFMIPRLAPGDPVAAMVSRITAQAGFVEGSSEMIAAWRARFGLGDPLLIQYARFLYNSVTLNLGYSLANFPMRVEDLIARSMPWTIGLLSIATILSFVLGNTVGALLGWRKTPKLARRLLPLSLVFTSIPFFMLAILLIYVFAFGLRWFPVTGAFGRGMRPGFNLPFIRSVIHHGTLPALSIILATMGFWGLGMRGMMITNDGEDYMILAQAKGLRASRIFWLYGVRNSVLPQITALALAFGSIVGGSILVEFLFAYPGVGYLLYQAIVNSDYTLIQGIVFMLIVATATAVFILDLLYPLIDPRISYRKR